MHWDLSIYNIGLFARNRTQQEKGVLQRLARRDAILRVDLKHLHQEVHRHVHHPLLPLAPDEHVSQRSGLDEWDILHIAIHLLQSLDHRFRPEEGAELHQLVILIQRRFLVKQRVPSRQYAHEHDATRPDVQRCGLVNHLRQDFGSAEALRSGCVSKTCTGGIVANGATAVRVLEMLDDVDDEPRLFIPFGITMPRLQRVHHFEYNSLFHLRETKIDEDANARLFGIPTMKIQQQQYKKLRGLMSR